MENEASQELLKRILSKLDLNFLSYVGYPPDDNVPYPESFLEGYHKCIEDFIHETERLGFNTRVQSNHEVGESFHSSGW
jgi:hypothetical protein